MKDLTITRNPANRREAIVAAHTDAGRAFLAAHCGAGAVSVTLPRENVHQVLAAIEAHGTYLDWSRARGTCPADA